MSRASTKAQAPGGRPPDDQESLRTLHHAFDVLEPGSSRSLAEAAARFSLSNPTVSSIIPGARSPQEAEMGYARLAAWTAP